MNQFEQIAVLGAGAWGTALAYTAQQAGRKVTMLAREEEVAEALSSGRGNPAYLPGVKLPPIETSTDVAVLEGAGAVLAVVPAQFARENFRAVRPAMAPGTPVLLCAKGIEQSTLSLMTDVLTEELPEAVPAVLSGPSFAADVARGLPTAVTLACHDGELGHDLMAAIGRDVFRPYWSDDLIGAEIGGAVKNVLAIACGMVEGLQLGRSAHAALLTRGFAEMTRLGIAMGGRADTLAGLSGLGDLVLTCSSVQSRNMSFGKALGEGRTAEELLSNRTSVVEGVVNARSVAALATRLGVDMPICQAIDRVLHGGLPIDDAIELLMVRPLRAESAALEKLIKLPHPSA